MMMVEMIIMMTILEMLIIIMTKITNKKKHNKYGEFWVEHYHFRDYYMVKKGPINSGPSLGNARK